VGVQVYWWVPMKEFWKSVQMWRSYHHEFGLTSSCFWNTVYIRWLTCPIVSGQQSQRNCTECNIHFNMIGRPWLADNNFLITNEQIQTATTTGVFSIGLQQWNNNIITTHICDNGNDLWYRPYTSHFSDDDSLTLHTAQYNFLLLQFQNLQFEKYNSNKCCLHALWWLTWHICT